MWTYRIYFMLNKSWLIHLTKNPHPVVTLFSKYLTSSSSSLFIIYFIYAKVRRQVAGWSSYSQLDSQTGPLCHLHSDFLGLRNFHVIIIISVPPKGRSFTANSGTKDAVLPRGRSSTANSRTKVQVSLGMNRCGSLPLFSAPLSLYLASEQTLKNLKRSQGQQWGGEESGFG